MREHKSISIADQIFEQLERDILTGRYPRGEVLSEMRLSTELGVSRTPIREAFKLLENEGLIDYIPNRGCFAKGFTKQDVDDIYAVREALEELAVRWAVARITEPELTALEEQVDLMEFYTKKKDKKRVLELNTSFHEVIYASARSRFLAQVLRSYKEYIEKTRKSIFYEQSYLEGILSEHRAIFEAIKDRDEERAVEAISKHLEASQDRAESVWNLK